MTKPTKWFVRPAKIQISLGIHPVWSESSLSAWRKLGSLATHWAHSEDWSEVPPLKPWGASFKALWPPFPSRKISCNKSTYMQTWRSVYDELYVFYCNCVQENCCNRELGCQGKSFTKSDSITFTCPTSHRSYFQAYEFTTDLWMSRCDVIGKAVPKGRNKLWDYRILCSCSFHIKFIKLTKIS